MKISKEQIKLPGFDGVPSVEIPRAAPQPRQWDKGVTPTPHEIMYRAFNLPFRAELSSWLRDSEQAHGYELEDVLPEQSAELVRGYLFPHPPDDRWWSQEHAMEVLTGDPRTANVRRDLKRALVRIWRRNALGPTAIEILKPPWSLYRTLIKRGINTIEDLLGATPEDVAYVCGSRPVFNGLKSPMQRIHPEWDPPLTFRDELPP